jgi:hypothetical protein
MPLQWVFRRAHQTTTIDLDRTLSHQWVISVIDPHGRECRVVPSLIDAVLHQTAVERELISAGWHLENIHAGPADVMRDIPATRPHLASAV